MSLTLQQFIEGCMQFPIICGWHGGETCILTDDVDGEVEMLVDIHKNALEKIDSLSDAFDEIRDKAKKLFGENLTNVVINEKDGDAVEWSSYYVTLRFRYKESDKDEC